jgi:hypothetical protein
MAVERDQASGACLIKAALISVHAVALLTLGKRLAQA